MPLKAKCVIAVYVGLYLLASVILVTASILLVPYALVSWILGAVLLVFALLSLDALYPKVSLFADSLYRIPQKAGVKTIALTFDDGPVNPYTGQILDILDQYNVKASFFCIGENVRRNPGLALEIVRRGHTLGNHSQTHQSLLLKGSRQVRKELEEAQLTIRKNCGIEATFFRCPKGYKSLVVTSALRRYPLTLTAYGYPIWDVQNPPAHELVERVLKRAAAGDIVLMHDGFPPDQPGRRDSLVAALPQIIEGLLARNITPVSLDQAIRQRS